MGADEESFLRYPQLEAEVELDGHRIGLDHILEASAITTELMHLYSVHGITAMEMYYASNVRVADPIYSLLIEKFIAMYGNSIPKGTSALYAAVGISLYSSDSPVEHFAALYKVLRHDTKVIRTEVDHWLSDPFPEEGQLAERILSEQLIEYPTRRPIGSLEHVDAEFPIQELAELHQTLYRARRSLGDIYVKQFRYSPNLYTEHLHEFASPVLLFYPLDSDSTATVGPALRQRDLDAQGIETSVISAMDSDLGRVVLAGLRPLSNTRPCLSLAAADAILFANFCYGYLFTGSKRLYSRGVDEMYLQVLRQSVLGTTGLSR